MMTNGIFTMFTEYGETLKPLKATTNQEVDFQINLSSTKSLNDICRILNIMKLGGIIRSHEGIKRI
jgi:hypothetical protein